MQVCLEYSLHVKSAGLSLAGLTAMYTSGHGDLEADYEALGLNLQFPDEQVPSIPCRPEHWQSLALLANFRAAPVA
jgi:trehalose/maltose hydrolase-like predicted phosphorylase